MLCVIMAIARPKKLTLKEKINLIDASHIHTTFPDSVEGINAILMFFGATVEKLKSVQNSLCAARVETACKLRQTSMNDFIV